MGKKLNLLEKEIIEAILKCEDNKISEKLYKQYKFAEVMERKYTGVGFFTKFYIADSNEDIFLANESVQFGGIHAEIKGLKNGAGFVLFVKDGKIKSLEGHTYNESWPTNAQISKIFVVQGDGALIPLDS